MRRHRSDGHHSRPTEVVRNLSASQRLFARRKLHGPPVEKRVSVSLARTALVSRSREQTDVRLGTWHAKVAPAVATRSSYRGNVIRPLMDGRASAGTCGAATVPEI